MGRCGLFRDPLQNLLGQVAASGRKPPEREAVWARLVNEADCRRMAEIGVWKAEFARRLLSECPTLETYCVIDPWRKLEIWNKPWNLGDREFERVFSEAPQNVAPFASKTVVLRGTTSEVIRQVPDESLDLACIDDDHTLRGITVDLFRVYPKVRPGGFLGGDDFCDNIWQHSREFEPSLVCPFVVYFAEAVDAEVFVLPCQQFLIRKPVGATGFRVVDLTARRTKFDLLSRIQGRGGGFRPRCIFRRSSRASLIR